MSAVLAEISSYLAKGKYEEVIMMTSQLLTTARGLNKWRLLRLQRSAEDALDADLRREESELESWWKMPIGIVYWFIQHLTPVVIFTLFLAEYLTSNEYTTPHLFNQSLYVMLIVCLLLYFGSLVIHALFFNNPVQRYSNFLWWLAFLGWIAYLAYRSWTHQDLSIWLNNLALTAALATLLVMICTWVYAYLAELDILRQMHDRPLSWRHWGVVVAGLMGGYFLISPLQTWWWSFPREGLALAWPVVVFGGGLTGVLLMWLGDRLWWRRHPGSMLLFFLGAILLAVLWRNPLSSLLQLSLCSRGTVGGEVSYWSILLLCLSAFLLVMAYQLWYKFIYELYQGAVAAVIKGLLLSFIILLPLLGIQWLDTAYRQQHWSEVQLGNVTTYRRWSNWFENKQPGTIAPVVKKVVRPRPNAAERLDRSVGESVPPSS